MSRLQSISIPDLGISIGKLRQAVEAKTAGSPSLDAASQTLVDALYAAYRESVVLTRVFVTVPFSELPWPNQQFVKKLAASAAVLDELKPTTLVLSLAGSSGVEASWNGRRGSVGHVGIPLTSSSFIDAIPMMSRLLKSLGGDLSWIDATDTSIITKKIGSMIGVFYVQNAENDTDNMNRKVISAQDFVKKYRVRSVFGIGGAYIGFGTAILIVFTRDDISKAQAEMFMPLLSNFTMNTRSLVQARKVFSY